MRLLYPDGIRPDQYEDVLLLARDFDKNMRIANHRDAFGENPYSDKIGYAILGFDLHQSHTEESTSTCKSSASGPDALVSSEQRTRDSVAQGVRRNSDLELSERSAKLSSQSTSVSLGRLDGSTAVAAPEPANASAAVPPAIQEEYWARTDRSGSCWLWLGRRSKEGYAQLAHQWRVYSVHRIAWEIAYGHIPLDKAVYHTCATKHCVNPQHLRLDALLVPAKLTGERHPAVKISDADAAKVVMRYAAGGVTMDQLGQEFGINRRTVGRIVHARRKDTQ